MGLAVAVGSLSRFSAWSRRIPYASLSVIVCNGHGVVRHWDEASRMRDAKRIMGRAKTNSHHRSKAPRDGRPVLLPETLAFWAKGSSRARGDRAGVSGGVEQ